MQRKKRRSSGTANRRLSVEALEDRRLLATFSVSNLNDAGTGSLRAAIDQANANSGADDIAFFGAANSGTIALTSGELEITETLTISGPGQGALTIDAQQNSRVLNFSGSGDLTLSGLTVTGGRTTGNNPTTPLGVSTHSGGGIRFAGGDLRSLILNNVTVSGNRTEGDFARGGGVFSSGFTFLNDSVVNGNRTTNLSGRGGGVLSVRNIDVIDSTVSGNRTTGRSSFGGGIASDFLVTIINSTVSGNSTTGNDARGGGVFTFGDLVASSSTFNGNTTAGDDAHGGGISTHGNVTITSSTVSGNRVTGLDTRGGGMSADGDITIAQSTVTENFAEFSGGGVHRGFSSYGDIVIDNTIVSANTTSTGFSEDINGGFIGSTDLFANWSLLGFGVDPGPLGFGIIRSDNPMLGPLANNIGPTRTHMLQPGSPAINTGDPSITFNAAEFDQRGAPFVRVSGSRSDIGAVELQPLPNSYLIVDSSSNIDDGDFSAGQLSLREAIGLANFNPGADTILFDSSVSGGTMNLAGTELEITEELTIDATSLNDEFIIDAEGGSRIFNINTGDGDYTFAGLTLLGGRTTDNFQGGAAILSSSSGSILISDSRISGNQTDGVFSSGGAIYAQGEVSIADSTLIGNTTTGVAAAGGGIFSTREVIVTNSRVTNNRTTGTNGTGGAIRSMSGVTIHDSTVSSNSTSGFRGNGGAISSNGDVTMTEAIITTNHTAGDESPGGGVSAAGIATFTDSNILNNRTEGVDAEGGGVFASGNIRFLDSGAFLNTTAGVDSAGGALSSDADIMVIRGDVSVNSTAGLRGDGGGLHSRGAMTISDSFIGENITSGVFATGGGASSLGLMTLTNSTVSGNTTSGRDSYGGGVFSSDVVVLYGSTISDNNTTGDDYAAGGGVAAFGNVTITSSTISGNETSGYFYGGGGILSFGSVTVTSSTITDNHASAASFNATGGGIQNFGDPITVTNSIIDGNTAFAGGSNIDSDGTAVEANFSLIKQFALPINGSNNITTMSANLGPLEDNGGLTETHALLPGSPAIDAGDPAILFDANQFDQRGEPFVRVFDDSFATGSGIDMGSYERQVLPLIVDTIADEMDGDYAFGDLSLREAIGLANDSLGNDIITFDASLANQTITLDGTRIGIFEEVTIDASGLAGNVTIDAGQQSRVLDFSASTGDLSLTGLIITGGRTVGDNSNATELTNLGGGIRFLSDGELVLTNSTVTGNSTEGFLARGGGIFSLGAVSLIDSTVEGNSTAGNYAHGGGIYSSSGAMTLTNSTVSGNSTGGFGADGGGIHFRGSTLTLINSTASGNSTTGDRSDGGAVYSQSPVTLTSSTLSGNSTAGNISDGGGLYSKGAISVHYSTIADNHANGGSAIGGGIWNQDDSLDIRNSIVAGNSASGGMNDIAPGTGTLSAEYSLFEQTGLAIIGSDNIVGLSANLAPLADNGGPTQTHMLLPGSPAIDAGNPGIAFDPSEFDQRGASFMRVVDGDNDSVARIDIGAYERQSGFSLACDFDGDEDCDIDDIDALMMEIAAGTDDLLFDLSGDGMVGLADRDEWLFDAGTLNLPSGSPYLAGDSNLDGTVDGQDFLVWNSNKFTPTGTWSQADWNGDGTTDGQDFLVWNSNKFQSGSSPQVGVPLGIEFDDGTLVDYALVDVRNSWLNQGQFFLDMEISGLNGVFQHHGDQLVAVVDTTVIDVDRPIASVIVDWTTDKLTRNADETYTACVQTKRFMSESNTFKLIGEEKCGEFGPF